MPRSSPELSPCCIYMLMLCYGSSFIDWANMTLSVVASHGGYSHTLYRSTELAVHQQVQECQRQKHNRLPEEGGHAWMIVAQELRHQETALIILIIAIIVMILMILMQATGGFIHGRASVCLLHAKARFYAQRLACSVACVVVVVARQSGLVRSCAPAIVGYMHAARPRAARAHRQIINHRPWIPWMSLLSVLSKSTRASARLYLLKVGSITAPICSSHAPMYDVVGPSCRRRAPGQHEHCGFR